MMSSNKEISNTTNTSTNPSLLRFEEDSLEIGQDVLNSGSFTDSTLNYDSPDEKETCSLSASSSSESLSSSPDLSSSSPITSIPYLPEESLLQLDDERPFMESSRTIFERKRKERNEPSSSLELETKVIRASESPVGKSDLTFVGSDEKQKLIGHIITEPGISILSSISEREVSYSPRTVPVNFEPEIQRQWERTAAQWHTRKLKRHRPRHTRSSKSFSEVEDAIKTNYSNLQELTISTPAPRPRSSSSPKPTIHSIQEDLDMTDGDSEFSGRSLSPLPSLDFSTLHHQIDSEVPLLCTGSVSLSDQVMLSPRNSVIIGEEMEKIAPSPPLHQFPLNSNEYEGTDDSRANFLSRQISQWKRQIKILEIEHEQMFGYKPSHSDKLNQKDMRKYLLQINKAKKELKQIREEGRLSVELKVSPKHGVPHITIGTTYSLGKLEETVRYIENELGENRRLHKRSEDPAMMSQTELLTEKNLIEKHLISIEQNHGRPSTNDEKEIVKGLYDRYRVIRRISSRFTTVKENSLDLVPILEYETLELTNEGKGSSEDTSKQPSSSKSKSEDLNTAKGDSSHEVPLNEDYHDMDLSELESRYKYALDEKRNLRSIASLFDAEFFKATGRWPTKEDRNANPEMEKTRHKYKHIRATVRLLQVLISKRKYPTLLKDYDRV